MQDTQHSEENQREEAQAIPTVQSEQEQPKQYTAQDFADAYQELCNRMGFEINCNPAWIGRDDGTWSTKLQFSVGLLPKK